MGLAHKCQGSDFPPIFNIRNTSMFKSEQAEASHTHTHTHIHCSLQTYTCTHTHTVTADGLDHTNTHYIMSGTFHHRNAIPILH